MKKDSVLVYSGGMDSTVMLHEFKDRISKAIYFNYGSRHMEKEYARAKLNCDKLGIPLVKIDLDFIHDLFKSSLLDGSTEAIPDGDYREDSMKSTVVPFRNGIMLSIAAGIAESEEMGQVMIANHAGDHTIYPDCRPEFIVALSTAMTFGTYNEVKINAPYANITKRDIAIIGQGVDVDFENTYSCYKGGDIHCGTCGTCVERKEALEGFDPTQYIA